MKQVDFFGTLEEDYCLLGDCIRNFIRFNKLKGYDVLVYDVRLEEDSYLLGFFSKQASRNSRLEVRSYNCVDDLMSLLDRMEFERAAVVSIGSHGKNWPEISCWIREKGYGAPMRVNSFNG